MPVLVEAVVRHAKTAASADGPDNSGGASVPRAGVLAAGGLAGLALGDRARQAKMAAFVDEVAREGLRFVDKDELPPDLAGMSGRGRIIPLVVREAKARLARPLV